MEENQTTPTSQVESNSTPPGLADSNAQNSQNPQAPTSGQPAEGGTPDDTKTIVTVLLLIFFYPVGLILMWVWTTWKGWVKWLITSLACLPVIIFFFLIFSVSFLSALNPQGAMKMAECSADCETYVGKERDMCVKECAGDQYLEYLDEGHSDNDLEVEGY